MLDSLSGQGADTRPGARMELEGGGGARNRGQAACRTHGTKSADQHTQRLQKASKQAIPKTGHSLHRRKKNGWQSDEGTHVNLRDWLK
jgi:hypothetical protein